MLKSHRHSCYGIAAILLWSCLIALSRSVSEQLGPIGGAAGLSTVSSLLLVCVMGLLKHSRFSKSYLMIGGALFVCYELFLALALGMANGRHQALEMAVIGYLWPALTVLFAVLLSDKKINWLVYPSIFLAFFGVAWVSAAIRGFLSSKSRPILRRILKPIRWHSSAQFIWGCVLQLHPTRC